MSPAQIESEGVHIVLLGSFNPAILQPFWFVANGLVTEEVAEAAAELTLVSPDITAVGFPEFSVEVVRDRLTFASTSETATPNLVRDAAANVLNVLSHTPVQKLGMNVNRHVRLEEGRWEAVSETLIPRGAWERSLTSPEIESVTVSAQRNDDLRGRIRLTLQPSQQVAGGAWLNWNSHVELAESGENVPAGEAADVLERAWDDTILEARRGMDSVLELT